MAENNLDLTPQDLSWIAAHGITEAQVREQIEKLKRGPMALTLIKPATIGDGILRFDALQCHQWLTTYEDAPQSLKSLKFVPASGAATRMFKSLIHYSHSQNKINGAELKQRAANGNPDDQFLLEFFSGLENGHFAFHQDLHQTLLARGIELSPETLIQQGEFKEILDTLLTANGLNYGNLPKALIKFHHYGDHSRTAIEEHLVEGRTYAKNKSGDIYLHFTISPQFKETIMAHLDQVLSRYQKKDERFHIDYSIQHASTDTVAVDEHNQVCRDPVGKPILRPGGHGALIENLNTLDADIIFIKNIDNVVPDHLKPETIRYKKVLAGYLLHIQTNVFAYLQDLSTRPVSPEEIKTIGQYARQTLNITFPENFYTQMTHAHQMAFLIQKLNRPIRVCGMVKNQGEPGGGPFWIQNEDGTSSLQIIENAQINKNSETQQRILATATHFNPVDLVCGVKNFQGEKFNLEQFTDPNTYFISEKSNKGHTIKALELPGLWNGAMANWITIFVEVPLITFNPIKTVNDLLRDTHH